MDALLSLEAVENNLCGAFDILIEKDQDLLRGKGIIGTLQKERNGGNILQHVEDVFFKAFRHIGQPLDDAVRFSAQGPQEKIADASEMVIKGLAVDVAVPNKLRNRNFIKRLCLQKLFQRFRKPLLCPETDLLMRHSFPSPRAIFLYTLYDFFPGETIRHGIQIESEKIMKYPIRFSKSVRNSTYSPELSIYYRNLADILETRKCALRAEDPALRRGKVYITDQEMMPENKAVYPVRNTLR